MKLDALRHSGGKLGSRNANPITGEHVPYFKRRLSGETEMAPRGNVYVCSYPLPDTLNTMQIMALNS